MAIHDGSPNALEKRIIDLSGPEGNAYVLLGLARNYAMELGLEADEISEEMRAGDYENLITVFDKYFGDYVDLYRGDHMGESE